MEQMEQSLRAAARIADAIQEGHSRQVSAWLIALSSMAMGAVLFAAGVAFDLLVIGRH